MKVLFVTGGDECRCKGTGIIDARVRGDTFHVNIRTLCTCVEAREATVETTDYSGDDAYLAKNGRVVPEDER